MTRVGLIFGSRSVEHEISITTASKLFEALAQLAAEVETVPIYLTKTGAWLTGAPVGELLRIEARGRASQDPVERKRLQEEYKAQLGRLDRWQAERQVEQRFLAPDATLRGLAANPERASWFKRVARESLDIAFPVIHGTHGEDGTLQGLFELADLPYVGPGPAASAAGMDKILSKLIFRGAGLPTVEATWFTRRQWLADEAAASRDVEARLGYPVVVKPAVAGSSVGIGRAANREELARRVGQAILYSQRVLVERAVDERLEIQCAVLGNHELTVSACEELVQGAGIVSFEDKYLKRPEHGAADLAPSVIPAKIPAEMAEQVTALSRAAFTALDARGISRVDILVDRRSMQPFVNEVNTLPGSFCLRLWEASGLAPAALVRRLLALALEAHDEKGKTRFTSAEGAGLVDRKHLMAPGK
jgi:D-alanine-D-alanine ligase